MGWGGSASDFFPASPHCPASEREPSPPPLVEGSPDGALAEPCSNGEWLDEVRAIFPRSARVIVMCADGGSRTQQALALLAAEGYRPGHQVGLAVPQTNEKRVCF